MNSYEPIKISKTYNCTSEQLWSALTNINEMRKWYFEALPDFKPEVGFSTSFLLVNEGRKFTHQFRVLEVDPGRMIKYTFNFAEYDGDGFVQFVIAEAEGGCLLNFSSVVTKDYPSDIPEFKRESGAEGWNWFLGERLEGYLDTSK